MVNDALLEAVEDELKSRPWRLRFADKVEARFEEDTQRQRSRNMVVAGLVSAFIYSLFLINDYSYRPDAFTTALLLRVGIMLPFGLPILWFVYRGVSPVFREALMASIVIVATVLSCLIFVASLEPYSYLDVFSFGLILVVGNIVYSLRFGYACASTAISILIMLVFILVYEPMPPEAKRLAVFTIFANAMFTLVANYRLEHSERMSYLHVLREKLRAGNYLKDNQKLSKLSMTDSLTNIANRRHFDTVFPLRWQDALEKGSYLELMMIDIDHFKAYNDHYGHLQGDHCLRQVAMTMQAVSREEDDLVVRYGGEEFVVLMSNVSPDAAKIAAERIRHSVENMQIKHHGEPERGVVTVSVGAALLRPTVPLAQADLLAHADLALYEAKRQGRNCICVTSLAHLPYGGGTVGG